MRLALTSDLHVDHHPDVVPLVAERVRELAADVLIVAGDVSVDLDHLEDALSALARSAPHTVFVPGNHDLWMRAGEQASSRARYESLLPERARRAGCAVPFVEPVEIDGLWFAGTTGWYDYSLRSRALDETFSAEDYRKGSWGKLRWSDKQRIHWPSDDEGRELEDPEICAAHVRALDAQLDSLSGRDVVVVTHHLPFAELVTSRGEVPWDFLNGFMGSASLGETILARPGVRLACAGHTHFRKTAFIDGVHGRVRAETSPVGYPREYGRASQSLAERVRERVISIEQ